MNKLNRKKLVLGLFLLAGAGYFGLFSQLEMNGILKNYVALMPMQAAALLYVLLRSSQRNTTA